MPRLAHSIEASLVLVEDPKNVRAPEGCPEPWFWVRGDDLTGLADGDTFTTWTDRGTGGNDLTPDTSFFDPVFAANVIDGIGGLRSGGGLAGLGAQSFVKPFPDGMTIFAVVTEQGGDDIWEGMVGGQTGLGASARLSWYVSDEGVLSTTGEQYLEFIQFGAERSGAWYAYDTGFTFPAAVLWRLGPDLLTHAVNGAEQQPDGAWDPAVDTPSWDPVPEWGNLQLFSQRPTEQTAEVIIFDTVLTPECEAQWWSYLAGRYPSLGVV